MEDLCAGSSQDGNLEYRHYRAIKKALVKRCRNQLAVHIKRQTGQAIDPLRVRLIPKMSDFYTWAYTPGDSHLFAKNLGQHSIPAYKELHNKVGKTFFAIPRCIFSQLSVSPYPKTGEEEAYGAEICRPDSSLSSGPGTEASISNDRRDVLLLEENLIIERTCKEQLLLELEAIQAEYEALGRRFELQAEKAKQSEDHLFNCFHTMSKMSDLAAQAKTDYANQVDFTVFVP
ncbi:uncharacterized protein FFNC_15635 [Fusarium fujikuroi]|nr:uncharacterized protein FFNC_15635 [Fusarium fujikuroi]